MITKVMAVGEIMPLMLASTFIAMVGVMADTTDGDGVVLGYGTTGVMEDIMVMAGTTHGDGIDGTIGVGEVTTDMAMDTDGVVIITHGITLITVTAMVIMVIGIMAGMATITITPIIGAEEVITTTIHLPTIALQEI